MKKIFKIIEWLVFVVILFAILIIASPFLLIKQSVSSYTIVSGSMRPTIPIGSLTFVKQFPFDTLKKGDIVAFTDPTNKERVILHRIFSISQTPTIKSFQTKGDNNKASDAWKVSPGMVKGRLFFTVPYLGYMSELLKTPLGFGLMIGIPALLFIFLSILKVREGIKEEIEKGIARREKKTRDITQTLLTLAVPFFISTLILAIIPPIYGLQFGNVTLSHIIVTFAKGSPTATPTPTKAPTPTPTSNPTVCPTGTGGTTIDISGNGAGSTNTVDVTNSNTTTITQSNNTSINTNINFTNNTGYNTSNLNTGGNTTIISSSSATTINVTTTGNTNTVK